MMFEWISTKAQTLFNGSRSKGESQVNAINYNSIFEDVMRSKEEDIQIKIAEIQIQLKEKIDMIVVLKDITFLKEEEIKEKVHEINQLTQKLQYIEMMNEREKEKNEELVSKMKQDAAKYEMDINVAIAEKREVIDENIKIKAMIVAMEEKVHQLESDAQKEKMELEAKFEREQAELDKERTKSNNLFQELTIRNKECIELHQRLDSANTNMNEIKIEEKQYNTESILKTTVNEETGDDDEQAVDSSKDTQNNNNNEDQEIGQGQIVLTLNKEERIADQKTTAFKERKIRFAPITTLWDDVAEGRTMNVKRYTADCSHDLDIPDYLGFTALHSALDAGESKIANILISGGANPNALNVDGATPLHFACLMGDFENVEQLLLHGANPNIKNNFGQTPLEMLKDFEEENKVKAPQKVYDAVATMSQLPGGSTMKYIEGKKYDMETLAPTPRTTPIQSILRTRPVEEAC